MLGEAKADLTLDDVEPAEGQRPKADKFKQWFSQSYKAAEPWASNAIESRKFVSGDQYSEEDRQRLRESRRPALTINKILAPVLFLSGIQRQQRQEPQILPFEGSDVRSADLLSALYKWVGQQSREPVVDSAVFMDKIVTGLGWWKTYVSFEKDIEGAVRWERVDPLSVFPDPNWLDSGWDAAEYVIQATWFTRDQALSEFPEHADEIKRNIGEWLSEFASSTQAPMGSGEFAGDSLSDQRLWWDAETQRVRVLECWYKKRVRVPVVINLQTQETETDPDRVAMWQQAIQQQPELAQGVAFARVPVTKVFVAHVLNDIVLDDVPSPYKCQEFPLWPTRGYYWHRQPFGIVEPLKDLQREKNKRRSTMVEMVQRAALSGFFNPKNSGAKASDLENYAAGTSKVIPFEQNPPIPIQPPELPQALVFLDSASDRDMQSVSNIHAELLGQTTQRTVSGRAIRARQESGLVVQEPLLESFAQDKEPAARFLLRLVQQFVSPAKAMRILGTLAMRQQGQGPEAELLQDPLIEVEQLLQGAFNDDYDVVVAMKPYEPSLKVQRWNILQEMAQQFGDWLPPDMLVDAAKDAGLLTEEQAQYTAKFVQQRMATLQQQQQMAAAGEAPAPPSGQ